MLSVFNLQNTIWQSRVERLSVFGNIIFSYHNHRLIFLQILVQSRKITDKTYFSKQFFFAFFKQQATVFLSCKNTQKQKHTLHTLGMHQRPRWLRESFEMEALYLHFALLNVRYSQHSQHGTKSITINTPPLPHSLSLIQVKFIFTLSHLARAFTQRNALTTPEQTIDKHQFA